MKLKLFFIFLFYLHHTIQAQQDTWSVQLAYIPGKLLKHSDKMLFNPDGFSQFIELNLRYHTSGRKDWERSYDKPLMGLGMRYLNFGQPASILGHGISISPFIDFDLYPNRKFSLRFKLSCGLTFLEKTYHLKINPLQTAIGSHWNNLTSFQFSYEHAFYKSHSLSAGICLTHISNGTFKAPNLGLNFISAVLAYSYPFNCRNTSSKNDSPDLLESMPETSFVNSEITLARKLSFESHYGISLKEAIIPGGPKFLIQWYFVDIGYQYNPYKSLRIGADLENNNIDSYFASYSELKPNKQSAGKDDWSVNAYIAHQWLFGNIALTLRNGYEFKRAKTIRQSPVVTKLDLYYIMPFNLLPHCRPYLGFSLKAHLDTAAYIGLLAGVRFHKINISYSEIDNFTY